MFHLGRLGRGGLSLSQRLLEVGIHRIVRLPLSFRRLDPHAGDVLVTLVAVVLALEVVQRLVLGRVQRELTQILLTELRQLLVQLLRLGEGGGGRSGQHSTEVTREMGRPVSTASRSAPRPDEREAAGRG